VYRRTGRPRGRPPLDPTDPSVSVSVQLPSKTFDQLDRRARLARCSMPELMRRLLRKAAGFDDERE
jgi:hypothetical protein